LQAPLLLVWSERTLDPITTSHAPALLAPFPVDPGTGSPLRRDIDVVTYAADPEKRRLPRVLDAWQRARRPGETLLVTGLDDFTPPEGVRSTGRLDRADFRALLRRARVFVAAPRREDYGIAALEALAEGCQLVTTPAPGPYPAREIARAADPRLVTEDVPAALRLALDDPRPDYAPRAAELLHPFATEAVDRVVVGAVLPRLLRAWGAEPTASRV
jgi:glycosyltransferase involved in cell wall biosynthesis